MHVVWFKRDLRVTDHAPLARAAAAGPLVCLYVYEPVLIASDEFDASHLEFINQSLAELDERLRELGGRLTTRVGAVVDVLDRFHDTHGIDTLWSHEETGNRITFDRDLAVGAWAKRVGVRWREIPQNGVVRRLRSRDGWAGRRERRMKKPLTPVPDRIPFVEGIDPEHLRGLEAFDLDPSTKVDVQPGGERHALDTLNSFLSERGEPYRAGMSSPVTAWDACSRLSPHLAWGTVSMRRVEHALDARRDELREAKRAGEATGSWLSSLSSFRSRLSWHCHFMQKLEDEPRIEFENMSPIYDGLREESFDQARFEAWCEGRTGYPMVDACMRALHRHSWINFRMRAMLVSFASYHLWLHWRPTAVYLARHFLDFEPGIHFSQVQMQSGTTGINTVRIYSPIKQAADQDPDGTFIRRYVPELEGVPIEYLAEPHTMPLSVQDRVGCRIGRDYPSPIVDHKEAYAEARRRMREVRGTSAARDDAKRVFEKHGSRKRGGRRRAKRDADQLRLPETASRKRRGEG